MATVRVHEAKTHPSKLIVRALAGESIVIARGSEPKVKLVPLEEKTKPRRVPGRLKGKIAIDQRFFEPLPEDELRAWEGE
ncbi:type II toxin-antitoxin system prevent-host-death family antitoxin [Sphingomonas gilva]|uniref:Antitoxin n=1 Tax=Sphingomonas gilva TaxID=2305907 RepID=A0A396RKG7_9SPHN|nr:type II toxin-antitoxin system prevent-host-death family antitoxin [Sphingomonas gilva]RHW16744.1 type II toxin-antitoxin system prevent-host-death family antitoxin [Sphingomonas gilva]